MKNGSYIIIFVVMALAVFSFSISNVYAQDNNSNVVNASLEQDDNSAKMKVKSGKPKSGFNVSKIPSLLFTYWQHQSIIDAKNKRGVVRPPTPAELEAIEKGENIQPAIRDITLGGIVYKGENDWTIWLNGERVTPRAVPEEVLDLRVFKDYIEVKWIDETTNQVFPIRLRTHQRFNLDMRIFLPG